MYFIDYGEGEAAIKSRKIRRAASLPKEIKVSKILALCPAKL